MVVAGGAVDRMSGRFARAVYFDALVPRDGASVVDLLPDEYQPYFTSRITADGRIPLADEYATVKPTADLIESAARHARSTAAWDYKEIDAPHDYMITHPLRTAEVPRRI